jgi:tRNA G18 (ribose-2'-O)-methylase SpoU
MAALSPVRSSSAIVVIADRPDRSTAMFSGQPLLMIAAGVQDPGNIGAIVRVAEAGGATGVIAGGRVGRPVRLESVAWVDGQRAALAADGRQRCPAI